MIRLWYQSFSRFDAFGQYKDALTAQVNAAADAGTHIDIHDLRQGGGVADQFRYPEFRDTAEVIENGLKAQEQGYDAFLIGNIVDPGIRELRELLTIPVLGLCETALSVACIQGGSLGLVILGDKFVPRITENVRRYGFTGRVAAVERMQVSYMPSLKVGFSDTEADSSARDDVIGNFTRAAQRCLDQGAEVLVPAGGVVMAMLAHAGIHEIAGAPILNGVATLTKMGETAVKLKRLTGSFTSKRNSYAPPRGDVLAVVRSAYGAQVYPGAD